MGHCSKPTCALSHVLKETAACNLVPPDQSATVLARAVLRCGVTVGKEEEGKRKKERGKKNKEKRKKEKRKTKRKKRKKT